MKIAFFGTRKEEEEVLTSLLPGVESIFFEEKLSIENINLIKDCEIISVFVGSEVSKDHIDSLPSLKYIATRSTGFDHVDVERAKEKKVLVSNVPAYGSKTVAEFTFALILTLSRRIFDAYHELRESGSFDISNLRGFDLYGKTLGVVGTGKIGKNVIKIANGFGMKVMAFDVYPDKDFAKENGFKYWKLEEVLGGADIVTLHVPYCKETHHLINKDNINKIKDGAYLINTSRGEVLETHALLDALKSKKLAGAGLDVLEGEKELKEEASFGFGDRLELFKILLEDHVIIDLPQTVVTPHIAFYTKEAERRILETTVENIQAFIKGKPQNIVNE